jgi:glycosyltransferase involved in cell wall biosynthesis
VNRRSDQTGSRDAVVVAPVFPARVRHFAQALEEEGRLRCLVTGYAYQPGAVLERCCAAADALLGSKYLPLLRRRDLPGLAPERVRRAVGRMAIAHLRRHLPAWAADPIRAEDALFQSIDRLAAAKGIEGRTTFVLAREDGALASFQRAKQVGARTVYDLPTAHHRTVREVLEKEEQEFPGACTFPGTKAIFTAERVEHKDAELQAADHIIAGSAFVRHSLVRQEYPAERVTVLPSACEEAWRPETEPSCAAPAGNCVLHVGRLSLRKGTHRLLRAWKRVGAYRTYRLRLVGDMFLSRQFLADYQGCYEHVGRVPPEELKAHYASSCLFVLPAAAEGFAAVILEALSCGLPILASRSSGAEGFLEHGKHVLLHDFGNEHELAAHLDWMLSHPKERVEMSRQAWEKARSWTWADYRKRFLDTLGIIERQGEPGCVSPRIAATSGHG